MSKAATGSEKTGHWFTPGDTFQEWVTKPQFTSGINRKLWPTHENMVGTGAGLGFFLGEGAPLRKGELTGHPIYTYIHLSR